MITCASCGGPIVKNEPFVLQGTEVFHRDATCIRGIATSLGTQQKLRIVELEREVRTLQSARRDVQDLERRVSSYEQTTLREHTRLLAERNASREAARDLERRAADLQAELDRERRAGQAAITELALMRALGHQAPSATPAVQPTVVTPTVQRADLESPMDDSAKRFSLLELDRKT